MPLPLLKASPSLHNMFAFRFARCYCNCNQYYYLRSSKSVDGECEVESALCVSPDRPAILKSRVSDSVRPTDRPAARSAAEQILSFFGSEDPTDRPSFTARGGSEAVSQAFQQILPDRPTLPSPTRRSPAGSDLPTDRPSQQPPRDAMCTFNFAPPCMGEYFMRMMGWVGTSR